MKCPYCTEEAIRVTGKEIYPHRPDLHTKVFYQCAPCEAYVGCHPNSIKPLGSLANAELRIARSQAHAAFDPLWQSGEKPRSVAYAWLRIMLGLQRGDCHIGSMGLYDCRRVVEVCKESK